MRGYKGWRNFRELETLEVQLPRIHLKRTSENAQKTNFVELRYGEVQHSPAPEDTGSPTG